MTKSPEPTVRALSAVSPARLPGQAAYIALGQRIFEESVGSDHPRKRARLPTSVVRELDQVSEHLLALAMHLARLATVIEQAGPPLAPTRGKFADRRAGS